MKWSMTSRVCLLTLVVAVSVLACLSLSVPPILDDVDQADYIDSFGALWDVPGRDCYGMFRPIKNLLFFFVLRCADGSMAAGHCISAALYVIATMLVVALMTRLFKNPFWGVCTGMVWGLAPTQVSSVAWFSCSNILITTAAVAGALLLYDAATARGEKDKAAPARLKMCCSGLLYLIALLSYESAVMFPVLLVLWDRISRPTVRFRSLFRGYAFLGVVTLFYIAMRLWRGGTWNIGSSGFSPMSALQVFATSACLVIDHLAMWFWPPGRQEILGTFVWDYSASPALLAVCWAGLLSAIVVLGVLIAMRSKRKSLACESGVPDDMGIIVFGLCWFVMSFVPMGNFIPVRSGPFADYYLVLPSLGLAAALVAMVRLILRPRAATGTGLSRHAVRVSAVLCAVLLVSRVVFVVTAFKWMTVWNSPKDLLRASMSARAYPYRARANLAKLLEEEGDLEEARRLATESAAEAPWYPLSFNVLGNIEVSEARYQDACAMFMQARELEPGAPYPCFALGFINEIHLGNEQEAATYYRVLLSMGWSRYAETAALNVSRMLALDGQFDEAIQILEAAIERAPYSADLRHNLTVARRQQATAVDQ